MNSSIALVHPRAEAADGNAVSAHRWQRLFCELGFQCEARDTWDGRAHAAFVALHAEKSHAALVGFREAFPGTPVIVVAAGTDIYGDAAGSPAASDSFERADRIVVLQEEAIEALPPNTRSKTKVIYQSVEALALEGPRPIDTERFDVCVLSNLRAIKDPMRAAIAARLVDPNSRLHVFHGGRVLDAELQADLDEECRSNPRYTWLGTLSHAEALERLVASRLLVNSSFHEGGANAVGEAVAHGVAVLATSIPGSTGLLGADYPGLYEAGNENQLATLFARCEGDPGFLDELERRVSERAPLFRPARERESWRALFGELGIL